MKKHLVYMIIPFLLNCQKSPVSQSSESECEKGAKAAKEDIKANTLGLYFFGLPNPRFNTRIKLLREVYEIQSKGGGDIISEEGECYNRVMEVEIKNRFGDNFFRLLDEKVDSLYLNSLGDREVSFPGGQKGIKAFLACNLRFFHVKESDKTKPVVYVRLLVGSDGAVKDVSIMKGFDAQFDHEALRVVRTMKGWIPAIKDKTPVKSTVILQVRFDPAEKNDARCR